MRRPALAELFRKIGAASVLLVVVTWLAAAPARAQSTPDLTFATGVVAFTSGDYQTAARRFREVRADDPDHLAAGHYLGRALMALEEYEEATDVLAEVSDAHPEAVDVRIDLAQAFLAWGNDAFAARTLAAVVREHPDIARARFLLGFALVRVGDCDLAAEHLDQARRLDPDLEPRARYMSGVCAARSGDLEEARRVLDPVARSHLDEPATDAARRIVQLSLRSEGIETRFFTGRAAISTQFDSNPTLAPGSLESYPSFGLVFQADGTFRAVATERHTLAGRVSFYRSFYFPDEHAWDFNFTHVAGSAYYQLRGESSGARHQLQLGYDFGLGIFDGERPLTDQNHLYSELHGGRVVWSARETDDLLTRVSLLIRHQTFAAERRNNLGVTVGVGQAVAIRRAALQLYVEATLRTEAASAEFAAADYDALAPGLLVSLSWRAPWELLVSGWVLYEHEWYPRWTEATERTDDVVAISLAVERQIVQHLGLTLSWNHWENISSLEHYMYRRDMVSLTVWGRL